MGGAVGGAPEGQRAVLDDAARLGGDPVVAHVALGVVQLAVARLVEGGLPPGLELNPLSKKGSTPETPPFMPWTLNPKP